MNNIKEIALDICDMCGSPYVESHSKKIETTINEYSKQESIEFLKWFQDKHNQMQITNIYLTEFDGCYNKIYELYLQYKTKQDAS